MEISVLILSCVILGLNPVLPVLLFFFFMICNLIWILPNKIHTYIHTFRFNKNTVQLFGKLPSEEQHGT